MVTERGGRILTARICNTSLEPLMNVSCIFFNVKLVEANPTEYPLVGISNCTANGCLIEA